MGGLESVEHRFFVPAKRNLHTKIYIGHEILSCWPPQKSPGEFNRYRDRALEREMPSDIQTSI